MARPDKDRSAQAHVGYRCRVWKLFRALSRPRRPAGEETLIFRLMSLPLVPAARAYEDPLDFAYLPEAGKRRAVK